MIIIIIIIVKERERERGACAPARSYHCKVADFEPLKALVRDGTSKHA